MMSITEIANLFCLSRQAVYVALKQGKFPATKKFGTRWTIDFEDYRKYHHQRYDRKFCKKEDGTLIFDKEKGIYSIHEAAKLLKRPAQHVYYYTRVGKIPASKYRAAWLLH